MTFNFLSICIECESEVKIKSKMKKLCMFPAKTVELIVDKFALQYLCPLQIVGCSGKSLSPPIVFSFFFVPWSFCLPNGGKLIARGFWANSHDFGVYCFGNKLTLLERVKILTNEKSIWAGRLDLLNPLMCANQQREQRMKQLEVAVKSEEIVLGHSNNQFSDRQCVGIVGLLFRL